MQQTHIDVHLRMPADLHRALRERARIEDRSIAATLRHAVRLLVSEQDRATEAA